MKMPKQKARRRKVSCGLCGCFAVTEGRGLTESWGGFVRRKRGDGCAACSRVCSELADGLNYLYVDSMQKPLTFKPPCCNLIYGPH
ncbi:hypothetical protein AV530_000126 [Patagioenas fasciata monilis]|uniref:Uncharacterized protein n=1 Tax=Patagioenas fasciata monilis TaxID=372326 RepID=A0A1V4K0A0_PATFA|nr:hypothetical protein AV530_000126 [Patagioenas fasciata monilis]